MTSEAVFIRSARWPMVLRRTVTCWLPPACPQAKTLPLCRRERAAQLVIEDEQTLLERQARPGGRPPCARTFCLSTSLTRSGITPALARYAT